MFDQETINQETEDSTMYTVNVQLNTETENYEFIRNGKPIEFTVLPIVLDDREGDRDPSYLVSMTENNRGSLFLPGTNTIKITVPLTAFPKGFFSTEDCKDLGVDPDEFYANSYTLLQGNTRYLGLVSLFSYNLSLYRAAKEQDTPEAWQAWEDQQVRFEPFQLRLISIEDSKDLAYVSWNQNSENNGVLKYPQNQVMRNVIARLDLFKKLHPDWSKEKIKNEVAAIFKFSVKAVEAHEYAAKYFPQWLHDRIEAGSIMQATAVAMVSAWRKQLEKHGVKLETVFNECVNTLTMNNAAYDEGLVITRSTVTQVIESIRSQFVQPEALEDVPPVEGEENGEGNGEGNGGDNPPNPDDLETPEQKLARLKMLLEGVAEHAYDLISLNLDPSCLSNAIKACDNFLAATLLTTGSSKEEKGKLVTVEMATQIEAIRQAEAEAKKAAQTPKLPELVPV